MILFPLDGKHQTERQTGGGLCERYFQWDKTLGVCCVCVCASLNWGDNSINNPPSEEAFPEIKSNVFTTDCHSSSPHNSIPSGPRQAFWLATLVAQFYVAVQLLNLIRALCRLCRRWTHKCHQNISLNGGDCAPKSRGTSSSALYLVILQFRVHSKSPSAASGLRSGGNMYSQLTCERISLLGKRPVAPGVSSGHHFGGDTIPT